MQFHARMIMNRSVTTLVIAATACLPFASSLAREEHRTIDAVPGGRITVANTAGSVELSGWSRNEVEVTADLGQGVEELIVERDEDEIFIKVDAPKHNARHIDSDLIIRVPENSVVDIGVVSADIDVSGVLGEQSLHSVSGDISTDLDGADAEVDTVSGDVSLSGKGKPIDTEVSSVSGDIEADGLSGSIDATSVSGDVSIVGGSYERALGNTVNGSIDFKAELAEDARLDFETINGRVDVHLVGEVSARFNIESFNGPIRSCFGPNAERSNRYGPGRELQFTEGSGSSRVTIQTLNGGIRLCKD